MDNISKEERSEVMRLVKSRDTKPELLVRKFLHSCGFRFRLHDKKLPGRPDIVLPKYRTVVFVHGCFWHGHASSNCKFARTPKSNIAFWLDKVRTNSRRDSKNVRRLRKEGWKVIVIYECQLVKKEPPVLLRVVEKIKNAGHD